jgi:hypothetical protein
MNNLTNNKNKIGQAQCPVEAKDSLVFLNEPGLTSNDKSVVLNASELKASDPVENKTKPIELSLQKLDDSAIIDDQPNRTKVQLTKLGLVYFGIELLFSIEVALTIPILLKLKVSERQE